jgi:SAM-dependent methyltransferase
MSNGEPTPWSGDDLSSWTADIRNGYSRAYIIHALRATGVLEALRDAGSAGASAAELAARCRVDPALLEGVLHYLALADAVIDKRGDRFRLGERGAWLFDPALEQSMLTFIDAYGCVMTELLPALRNEKRYGVDFVRSGEAVAVLSHLGLKATYGWVTGELARVGTRVAADLGCGSAEALIAFCQARPELHGIGIDVSRDALAEAERRVAAAGLADRVSLVWGDLTRPETLETPALADVDTFTCTTVLHEFLRDGEDAVIAILHDLARRFPRRHLIVGEFDALTDEEYRAMPARARVRKLWYQYLMHPLSLQGSPLAREDWIDLFERAGLDVLAVRPTGGDFFVDYFTLRLP